MRPISRYLVPAVTFLTPFLVAAQTGIDRSKIAPYSDGIINLINTVIVPLLFAIAFLYFVWGVFKYFFWGAENETERETGRQVILWSIIGFAVIVSVWGLTQIIIDTFNIPTGGSAPAYPTL